jgi:beta-mannosidase
LLDDGKCHSENRFFFDEPKRLELDHARVSVEVREEGRGIYLARVRSASFVKGVRLEIEGEEVLFDDNYFDVDPGIVKVVRFNSPGPLRRLQRKTRVRWI